MGSLHNEQTGLGVEVSWDYMSPMYRLVEPACSTLGVMVWGFYFFTFSKTVRHHEGLRAFIELLTSPTNLRKIYCLWGDISVFTSGEIFWSLFHETHAWVLNHVTQQIGYFFAMADNLQAEFGVRIDCRCRKLAPSWQNHGHGVPGCNVQQIILVPGWSIDRKDSEEIHNFYSSLTGFVFWVRGSSKSNVAMTGKWSEISLQLSNLYLKGRPDNWDSTSHDPVTYWEPPYGGATRIWSNLFL
jgi:hypothetical protein